MRQRLQIFGKDPQRPRIRAFEKSLVQIGDRTAAVVGVVFDHWDVVGAPSRRSKRFSNCLTVFNNSGSFGKAVMARSHSRASNAGDPDITRACAPRRRRCRSARR